MNERLDSNDSCCPELSHFVNEGKMGLSYLSRLHEIRLLSRTSDWIQVLNFCPLCGTRWANDLEERWWKEVERLGLEYEDFFELLERVPERLRNSKWWKEGD